MDNFRIGSIINDKDGIDWIVTTTWKYIDIHTLIGYFCMSLVRMDGGQAILGGARFQEGEAITVKR